MQPARLHLLIIEGSTLKRARCRREHALGCHSYLFQGHWLRLSVLRSCRRHRDGYNVMEVVNNMLIAGDGKRARADIEPLLGSLCAFVQLSSSLLMHVQCYTIPLVTICDVRTS